MENGKDTKVTSKKKASSKASGKSKIKASEEAKSDIVREAIKLSTGETRHIGALCDAVDRYKRARLVEGGAQ